MRLTRRQMILNGCVASLAAMTLPSCETPLIDPTPPAPKGGSSTTPASSTQTAQVNMMQLAQSVQTQQCEQWCWAACISMIFGFYGHPLSQAAIVASTYGNVVCLPAGTTYTIGSDLSRRYIDQRGIPFSSRVIAGYDPANGVYAINNQMIVDALSRSNPILYCNTHHAMVLYAVDYVAGPAGPDIRTAHVIDPWPFSPRTHTLTATEMYGVHVGGEMMFLAQVQVA